MHPAICVNGVSKRFGDVRAVENADLSVARGEFVALLGPSGCGKTTLLRLIAGFERPDGGTVAIDGRPVAGSAWVPPERRQVGMVFQDYALFPHLTVGENVGFGLPRRERRARVAEALELVGLAAQQRPLPAPALGRPAAARRAGAGAGAAPVGGPARRAVEQHRPAAPRRDARGALRHPSRRERDRAPRHPRARGGLLCRRPARADALGRDRPGGQPGARVPRAGQSLGRRVRRRRQRRARPRPGCSRRHGARPLLGATGKRRRRRRGRSPPRAARASPRSRRRTRRSSPASSAATTSSTASASPTGRPCAHTARRPKSSRSAHASRSSRTTGRSRSLGVRSPLLCSVR